MTLDKWIMVIIALVTSIGLVALRIDQWVHRRENTEGGVAARFEAEERARLERQAAADLLRIERERAVSRRMATMERHHHDLEDRVDDHGSRLRMLEQHDEATRVRLHSIEAHLDNWRKSDGS